jgi:hypothetical protein
MLIYQLREGKKSLQNGGMISEYHEVLRSIQDLSFFGSYRSIYHQRFSSLYGQMD